MPAHHGAAHATRNWFTVYRAGDADAATTAALLLDAATRLSELGDALVHHVEFDTVDDARRSEAALTVSFEPR